jgi:ELWxxDGT repeat protein
MMKNLLLILLLVLSVYRTPAAQTFSLVKDIAPASSGFQNSFPAGFTLYNGKFYFTAFNGQGGHKLYQSDGTANGTVVVGPSVGVNGTVYYLTVYNGKLIFTYDDGIHGLELWSSDGTTAGTVLLKDIWSGASSAHPQFFTEAGGKLFFQASDPTRSQGLWVTDGTEAGTVQVKNMYASPSNGMTRFMVLNQNIFFVGNTGSGYGLWMSDGTLNGTQLAQSGVTTNGSYAVLNGMMYFSAGDNTKGYELWVCDGTTFVPSLLRNIRSDTSGVFSSSPDNFFAQNNMVFFTADDGTHGDEWWVTDGTANGTHIVKDIAVGPNSSQPGLIISLNGATYIFVLNNGSGQMYRTDGTDAGTVLVKSPGYVSYVYEFKSELYFLQGLEVNATIWSSDGTTDGTKQILPPAQSYYLAGLSFIGYNDALYLPGIINDMGLELCKLSFPISSVDQNVLKNVPGSFELFQNYPNPFNPSTTIGFTLQVSGHTTLKIYDAIGREVAELANTFLEAGTYHQRTFDASRLSSGIYFARLVSDNKTQIKKMSLMK